MPYWIVVIVPEHKQPALRGPYYTEERAEERKDRAESEGCSAHVYELNTDNPDTATRLLKEKRIETDGIREGMRRFRHR